MSDNGKKKPVVFIKTFGCQMNEYDTEVAEGLLEKSGFEIVSETTDVGARSPRPGRGNPAPTKGSPDVILMNTCSVREHAEDRVYGRLGQLGKAKKGNPNLIVGLMGCMVEEHREKLFQRFPQLDLMVGTRNIKELPALIEEVTRNRKQVARIKQDGISIEYTDIIKREGKFHAWLPIMTGCNKVCTFCIVPITRGAEVSMPAREVYREASRLAAEGVKWITLLGQNVNSYKKHGAEGMGHGEKSDFPELLNSLCQIEGLERISFTTSHPHDATEELFQVIARNPKISRRFHLPLQSGSNKILKRMKRLHTTEEYKAKIERLRELVPEISVTTDIIAGFSGETEADHEATARALSEIRYDGAYIYKYSLRSGTPAAKLEDDVPLPTKEKRNAQLLALQKQITEENHKKLLGKCMNVFVEGRARKDLKQSSSPQAVKRGSEDDDSRLKTCGNDEVTLIGRSDQEKRVIIPGGAEKIGTFQRVKITGLANETFFGEIL